MSILTPEAIAKLYAAWSGVTPEWDGEGTNPAYEHNKDLIDALDTFAAHAKITRAVAKAFSPTMSAYIGYPDRFECRTYYKWSCPFCKHEWSDGDTESHAKGCAGWASRKLCGLDVSK